MPFARSKTRGPTFKRRSAMKMVHTTVDVAALSSAGIAGTVIGYTDINRQLSSKYGRNMPQACTYRVIGARATMITSASAIAEVGGAVAIQFGWLAPSRHRVAAHEAIMREYVEDVRDDQAHSRGRQLKIAFDPVQPVDLAESVLWRGDVANRITMTGASGAGTIGMMADYNARYPKPEGVAVGTQQPDQDLYTVPASETLDTVTMHMAKQTSWFDTFGDLIAGGSGITGRFNGPVTVFDAEFWCPSGTYLPFMCGLAKWIFADNWFPELQQGTDSTLTGGIIDPLTPTRGSFSVIYQFYVEGWTPLSKK